MLLGHSKIAQLLDTLLKEDNLAHGYIFYGPRWVGKRTFAEQFARKLEGGEKSERPLSDAHTFAPKENSFGIDAVREIRSFLSERPIISKKRTAIIDKGEMLTIEAQNALLKITEEPPASSLILLIITDLELLLPTLRSRLQKIYFGPITEKEIESWLMKEKKISGAEAKNLAKESSGLPGLAVRLKEDESLKSKLALAEEFFLQKGDPKVFLKKLLEDDNFNFSAFVDALVLYLASSLNSKSYILNSVPQWHSVLELRRRLEYAPLNPKIQLTNLLTK